KARGNFTALCTSEKGSCENAPNKKLHYLGCPIHRMTASTSHERKLADLNREGGVGRGLVIEVCLRETNEKAGLNIAHKHGSISMANSGENGNNTSQFFIVLTDDARKLAQLLDKYAEFGQVR
ncbi:hypothetical protein FISHEDRAFT_48660, partial [Fistulina hepatica ATCC 64428]